MRIFSIKRINDDVRSERLNLLYRILMPGMLPILGLSRVVPFTPIYNWFLDPDSLITREFTYI